MITQKRVSGATPANDNRQIRRPAEIHSYFCRCSGCADQTPRDSLQGDLDAIGVGIFLALLVVVVLTLVALAPVIDLWLDSALAAVRLGS